MVLQCSGHPLILSTMGLWKAADCPFHPLETSSLITVFLSEHSHFHAALANKGPAFFPRCFTSFVTYFPQKLCSFQKVTKKNLQFSFLSFFFFFLLPFFPFLFWCHYGDTPNWTLLTALRPSLPLNSCHSFPLCCVFMLFGLWSQWT